MSAAVLAGHHVMTTPATARLDREKYDRAMRAEIAAREIVQAWRREGACECHEDDQRLEALIAQRLEALDAAVRAARERCAQIVEAHAEQWDHLESGYQALSQAAAALRAPEVK